MRRIQIQAQTENKVFPTKFNTRNQVFKTSLSKIDNSISTSIDVSKSGGITTSVKTSDSTIKTKTDINNKPIDDLYFDEVIYYDGGGVQGYGD